ncbi:MAG: hypothetical protein IKX23_00445 [Treponema sp.]|nr:hypothetical protein [Treponema sp.]
MRKILVLLSLMFVFLYTGCTASADLSVNFDGSLEVKFDASFGKGFEALLKNAYGASDSQSVVEFANPQELSKDLAKSDFTNIRVVSQKEKSALSVTAKAPSGKTPLFESGLVKIVNQKIVVQISPKAMQDYYNKSDEQTQLFMDLLMAPVFTGEEMTDSEYISLIGSVYGKSVAEELKSSSFKLTLKNPDGTKGEYSFPLVKMLTLDEAVVLR